MERLIEYIAKQLVSKPDEVRVRRIDGQYTCIIELETHPEDLGKVIGKGGKTAQAMRALLAAGTHQNGKKTVLEILE